MKKSLFVLTIFFGFAFVLSSFAETLNIVVSGSIRTRVYYEESLSDLTDKADGVVTTTDDAGIVTTTFVKDDTDTFVENLVDIYIDAELSDAVYVRVNLEAFGIFGDPESWGPYVQEAWFRLDNIGGLPWSATVGSFYFNPGRGFLFSDNDAWFIFDGIMVQGDYNPVIVTAAVLRTEEGGRDDIDIYLADVDWNSERLTVGGTVATVVNGPTDYEPIVLSGRAIYNRDDSLMVFGEAVYELGEAVGGLDKEAWAVEVGGSYKADVRWNPTVRATYTYASGDDNAADGEDQAYDPLFNYTFYGYAYTPELTNIQIINVGLDLQPTEFTRVFADFYYYTQAEAAAAVVGRTDSSNPGVTAMTTGLDDQLGYEVDLGLTHNYTDDVTTSLIVSYFVPGDAYMADADDAVEIRGEIIVSF